MIVPQDGTVLDFGCERAFFIRFGRSTLGFGLYLFRKNSQ